MQFNPDFSFALPQQRQPREPQPKKVVHLLPIGHEKTVCGIPRHKFEHPHRNHDDARARELREVRGRAAPLVKKATDIVCPQCGAAVGEDCERPPGKTRMGAHGVRVDEALGIKVKATRHPRQWRGKKKKKKGRKTT